MKKFLIIAIAVFSIFAFTTVNADQTTNTAAGVIGGGQAMGQGQTQAINGPLFVDNTVNEAADLNEGRAYVNPATVQYGPAINYFGKPLPSEGFQPVEQIIMYSCWYTEGALMSMLKGVEDAEAELKVASEKFTPAAPATEDGETRWIKIVISRDKYASDNMKFFGFVTARSEDRKTTMVEVVAKSALKALQAGANVIHYTAQGAVRDAHSFGWGIGFATTQALIYDNDNTRSNVSAGGFGIAKATAGMRDKPWLQGFAIVDYDLEDEYPALKID